MISGHSMMITLTFSDGLSRSKICISEASVSLYKSICKNKIFSVSYSSHNVYVGLFTIPCQPKEFKIDFVRNVLPAPSSPTK